MDYPFLLKRSFALGDFENENISDAKILFTKDIEKLNKMAKRAIMGEEEDFILLARIALRFHEEMSFYLQNFEIDNNYYLNLAKEFTGRIEGEGGKKLLIEIYKKMGDMDAALEIAEELSEKSRDDMLLYIKLLIDSGKWGHAIELCEKMLEENPTDVELWKTLAYALFKAERYEDAERTYLKVLQMNRDDAESWFYRGLCLKNVGRWGGALQSFETAVRKNPKMKDAYENILEILEKRGMYARALDTLKKMRDAGFDVESKIKEMEEKVR